MLRTALLPLLLVAVAGCGDKSAVSLTAKLGEASVSVEELTLGPRLLGSFDLFLELGPEAPESTTVTVDAFGLLAAGDLSTIVQPLDATPSTELPLELAKGDRTTIIFTLNDQKFITSEQKDAICAGEVVIKGAVSDTLSRDKVTPVSSQKVTPGGC